MKWISKTLILDIPTFRTARKLISILYPPSPWYFVMAAWTDYDIFLKTLEWTRSACLTVSRLPQSLTIVSCAPNCLVTVNLLNTLKPYISLCFSCCTVTIWNICRHDLSSKSSIYTIPIPITSTTVWAPNQVWSLLDSATWTAGLSILKTNPTILSALLNLNYQNLLPCIFSLLYPGALGLKQGL